MIPTPDQQAMWDRKFAAGEYESLRHNPMPFAIEVAQSLSPKTKILELGCGVGHDAEYFASQGHYVVAVDFSEVVISKNREHSEHPNVDYRAADYSEPLPFQDDTFDVVYSNLALHYFEDSLTRDIFAEITRVLKPDGILAFTCKSPEDAENQGGTEVAPGVLLSERGHIRHFFTVDYVRALLDNTYAIGVLRTDQAEYVGKVVAFIKCIAKRTNE